MNENLLTPNRVRQLRMASDISFPMFLSAGGVFSKIHKNTKKRVVICLWTFIELRFKCEFDRKSSIRCRRINGTERLLWEAGRSWAGTLRASDVRKGKVFTLAKSLFKDIYMLRSASYCMSEALEIHEKFVFERQAIEKYLHSKGVPSIVAKRIYSKNVVRLTSSVKPFHLRDVARMIFALNGTDDNQSIEYWFRIINVDGEEYLSKGYLRLFYKRIVGFLAKYKVECLSFDNIYTQYCDMLRTDKWTLPVLKANRHLSSRVLHGFVNAFSFFNEETDERMNQKRQDDELFGMERSDWERYLDHQYDSFYEDASAVGEIETINLG
ncbi:unnamed protein product [Caenorhabditis bovis]|uniref:Uncharacterized protein n=1 Tax=Caenorhabditis bovis TaxID=2654633 RepID=A0A8S1ETP9_9PELO|nr:unnamed protein product [Caenorhabditis bovis]